MDLLLVSGRLPTTPLIPAAETTRKSYLANTRGAAICRPSRYVLGPSFEPMKPLPLVGAQMRRHVRVGRIAGSGVVPGPLHPVGPRGRGVAPRPEGGSARNYRGEVVQGRIRGVGVGDVERPVVGRRHGLMRQRAGEQD